MTAFSIHPVSTAISQTLKASPIPLENIEEFAGKGIRAIYKGVPYYLGSRNFLQQNGILIFLKAQQIQRCFLEGGVQSSPQLSWATKFAATPLKQYGPYPLRIQFYSLVTPKVPWRTWPGYVVLPNGLARRPLCKKREVVESLKKKGNIVCVLGDGINDAPALTAANIGISVLSAADISIQVSDILLTTDRLAVLPQVRFLARKAHRIIKQNLFWAFFYNAIGIVLAAAGSLTPIFAAVLWSPAV